MRSASFGVGVFSESGDSDWLFYCWFISLYEHFCEYALVMAWLLRVGGDTFGAKVDGVPTAVTVRHVRLLAFPFQTDCVLLRIQLGVIAYPRVG